MPGCDFWVWDRDTWFIFIASAELLLSTLLSQKETQGGGLSSTGVYSGVPSFIFLQQLKLVPFPWIKEDLYVLMASEMGNSLYRCSPIWFDRTVPVFYFKILDLLQFNIKCIKLCPPFLCQLNKCLFLLLQGWFPPMLKLRKALPSTWATWTLLWHKKPEF